MNANRTFYLGFLAALGLTTGGCAGTSEEPTVPVRGRILKGGLPFSPKSLLKGALPPGDPGASIVFIRMGGSKAGDEFQGSIDPDTGLFEVPGNTGKGIPESRYQVIVYLGTFGTPEESTGSGRSGGPPGVPPTGGGDDPAVSRGKELLRTEVEIPPGGKTDLVLEVDEKKKK